MSAIGDYVHYTAFGYAFYGTAPPRDDVDISGSPTNDGERVAMFENYKRAVENRVANNQYFSSGEKDEIENVLSSFINQSYDQNSEFWDWAKKEFEIEFNSLAPFIVAQGLDVQGKLKKAHRGKNATTSGMIERRINDINKTLSSLDQATQGLQFQELSAAKKRIIDATLKIVGSGYEILKNSGYSMPAIEQKFQQVLSQNSNFTGSGRYAILDAIDEAANIVQGLSGLKKGELFEATGVYVFAKANKIAYDSIEDLMKQYKVGQHKTAVTIDVSLFSEQIRDEMEKILIDSKYKRDEINPNLFVAHLDSPDKVDIQIDYNEKKMAASLKNLNFFNRFDISLTKEANVEQLLQNVDANLVNHFLNVMTIHGVASTPESRKTFFDASVRQAAKYALYSELALSAMIGSKIGSAQANVFIMNNNKAGKNGKQIYVFNIGDILEYAIENIDKVINVSGLGNTLIPNNWSGQKKRSLDNAYPRIAQVFAFLHQQKVRITIDKAEFRFWLGV